MSKLKTVEHGKRGVNLPTQLSAERLRHLQDFQKLYPSECLKMMSEATARFLRKHPEIARARRKALKAGKRWRPGKGWELEVVRTNKGRYLRVIEVPLPTIR